jgi:hypothetical protein
MLKDKDGGVGAPTNNNNTQVQAAATTKHNINDDLLAANAGSGFLLDSGIVIKQAQTNITVGGAATSFKPKPAEVSVD